MKMSLCFLLLMCGLVSSSAIQAPPCPTVVQKLLPCLDYIKAGSAMETQLAVEKPSQACCSGVKSISDQIKSKQDRIETCTCLKQILAGIGTYDPSHIPRLAKDCGSSQSLPPIDRNTDCNKT